MTVTIPADAPAWAQQMVQDLNRAVAEVRGRSPRPFKLPSYPVAGLPSAATYAGCAVYVTDGTSNKRLAASDGTNWRFPDGNIVS